MRKQWRRAVNLASKGLVTKSKTGILAENNSFRAGPRLHFSHENDLSKVFTMSPRFGSRRYEAHAQRLFDEGLLEVTGGLINPAALHDIGKHFKTWMAQAGKPDYDEATNPFGISEHARAIRALCVGYNANSDCIILREGSKLPYTVKYLIKPQLATHQNFVTFEDINIGGIHVEDNEDAVMVVPFEGEASMPIWQGLSLGSRPSE